MPGGPAHLDTFDYKPQTTKTEHPGSVFKFNQHGNSGLWVSELFPELAKHADKLCVLNGNVMQILEITRNPFDKCRPVNGSALDQALGLG